MSVRRIFVEKKPGFNTEAMRIYDDLIRHLDVRGVTGLRILVCYDLEGMTDGQFLACRDTVFADPVTDILYEDEFPKNEGDFVFSVKYLPGQYDRRADGAAKCVQAATGEMPPLIETAKFYVCEGNLTEDEKNIVRNYYVNPADSFDTPETRPETLKIGAAEPEEIKNVDGFILMSDVETEELRKEMGLAMSREDLLHCRDYFRDSERRNPTVTEIKVLDTYWSDHCRHSTFLTKLDEIRFDDGKYKKLFKDTFDMYLEERKFVYGEKEKDISLMDLAVMGMKSLKKKGLLNDLDESGEINACSIVINIENDGRPEEWLLMFKNETHNHPTEIEPLGGSETCLGGAIRDPMSGRAYVYQAMRVTGSGDPRTPVSETMPGKLPQRKITTTAATGYSSYGNQIGLCAGQATEIYDEGYIAKRMELGALVGAVKKDAIKREKPTDGDVVILVGAKTGRDGCGGATGSSVEQKEDADKPQGADFQKGNPVLERNIVRLFRNPDAAILIKRCNDFGAGGVSVAIGELADGLEVDLDAVPVKYPGLDGTELAIAESQERMAVVVDKDDAEKFVGFANGENLEATVVARVKDDPRLTIKWRGQAIVDISREFLDTNGVKQTSDIAVSMPENYHGYHNDKCDKEINEDLKEKWLENLRDKNVCGQKGLGARFDATAGAGTVFMPYGGMNQLTPMQVMAAKIPVESGVCDTASLMAFGYNPDKFRWSPFHGAVCAVVESVAKIAAAGGNISNIRLSFQEYFESLGNDAYKWGKPFAALLGAFHAQMRLSIPSIGGKDSMSGTYRDIDVPPALVSFAVAAEKADGLISNEFKKPGNLIVTLKTGRTEYGIPDLDEFARNCQLLNGLIKDKKVVSVWSVGVGGVAAAVSKMSFGNGLSFDIDFDGPQQMMFKPKYGSFVLEMECTAEEGRALLDGYNYGIIGKTGDKPESTVNGVKLCVGEMRDAWLLPMENVFPTGMFGGTENGDISIQPFTSVNIRKSKAKFAAPRVFIPIFPGTNCEYDAAARFRKAGAEVESLVLRTYGKKALEQSVLETVRNIECSQILMIPGGSSAGDEPDGAGKLIAAFLRNPYIREAVTELLVKRDGLVLGTGNGFQALLRLGLVPYGEIRDPAELGGSHPVLVSNIIGRHVSAIVRTKIISNASPWLYNTEVGEIHSLPVSHYEGRFAAAAEVIKSLAANGQIASQYVGHNGDPSMDISDNPNGSDFAVEGITSPDGHVFGKMAHSERIGDGLYRNVSGNYDQRIFEAGVGYFQ